jgi:methionine-gamma-lyase
MKKPKLNPESLMMTYGYKPELSEGALKCPIFQTSTFVFKTAEEGKAFFEIAVGLRERGAREEMGLIYSRINNPDLEILEDRLTLWDEAEAAAVFESGMSAISTTLLEFLKPGDLLLHSGPLYGGTDHFVKHFLIKYGIHVMEFKPWHDEGDILRMLAASGLQDRLAMIFLETPANPTNDLIDIEMCRRIADRFSTKDNRVLVSVDNTYLGPVFQHPIKLGADLVLYSATKYIGGHSDVIAGAVLGSKAMIKRVKSLRSHLGSMAGPWTGWLLMRSLETLKLRMEKQVENARVIADWLVKHPLVAKVHYLGLLTPEHGRQYDIYRRQCLAPGAMIAFEVKGGEKEAFRFLNNLKIIKLAVSLGSTESLAQHPASMTHASVDPAEKKELGITPGLIRLSVGVENVNDLIWAMDHALQKVAQPELVTTV